MDAYAQKVCELAPPRLALCHGRVWTPACMDHGAHCTAARACQPQRMQGAIHACADAYQAWRPSRGGSRDGSRGALHPRPVAREREREKPYKLNRP
eukprot:366301-Chlamydomonas_euryale.AAC.2